MDGSGNNGMPFLTIAVLQFDGTQPSVDWLAFCRVRTSQVQISERAFFCHKSEDCLLRTFIIFTFLYSMITVIVLSGRKLNNKLQTKQNKSETKRHFKLPSISYNCYMILKILYPESLTVTGSLIVKKKNKCVLS
jgi:hypothetical protein